MTRLRSTTTTLAAVLILMLAVSGCAQPAQHPAPRIVEVSQADRLTIPNDTVGKDTTCTAGYVDTRAGVILTAGHCGDDGDTVKDHRGRIIGTMQRRKGHDVARVIVDGKLSGVNSASGRGFDHSESIKGKRVCMRGAVSALMRCGVVHRQQGSTMRVDSSLAGVHGDSGAPVWSALGLVGIYTGVVSSVDGKTMFATVERVSDSQW